jgi:hypothetical protein
MYVYSGKVREGLCGDATPLVDVDGKPLFVGDIVIPSTIDEFGICYNTGLSVVVSDRYTSYSNGSHVEKEGEIEYFVMGIKSVNFMNKPAQDQYQKEWMVKKVKSYEDVVDGEHWKDYGFNFSEV